MGDWWNGRLVGVEVRTDLARLHAAQAGWARSQAVGLADYFRRNGREDEAATVRGDWPVVPKA